MSDDPALDRREVGAQADEEAEVAEPAVAGFLAQLEPLWRIPIGDTTMAVTFDPGGRRA